MTPWFVGETASVIEFISVGMLRLVQGDVGCGKTLVAALAATHAIEANVVISGDTAVLTWYDPSLGPERGVRSSDIFVYQGGHWHALYSQHSDASKE